RKGDRWLRTALVEAANSAAGRTKDTYLRAQYLRVKRRQGHKKAIVAVAHSILVAAYYILSEQKRYQDLGGDYFIRREDQERLTQRLVRQLERFGQRVTLEPAPAARRTLISNQNVDIVRRGFAHFIATREALCETLDEDLVFSDH